MYPGSTSRLSGVEAQSKAGGEGRVRRITPGQHQYSATFHSVAGDPRSFSACDNNDKLGKTSWGNVGLMLLGLQLLSSRRCPRRYSLVSVARGDTGFVFASEHDTQRLANTRNGDTVLGPQVARCCGSCRSTFARCSAFRQPWRKSYRSEQCGSTGAPLGSHGWCQ